MINTTYGLGGFDETKSNNNIVNEIKIDDTQEIILQQTQVTNLNSAKTKLGSLGLNEDEINAILGVSNGNN